MKTKILLAALLLISFVSLSAIPQSKPVQWEYKFLSQCDEKKTNALAGEGWELADMSMASYGQIGSAVCVFKRPK